MKYRGLLDKKGKSTLNIHMLNFRKKRLVIFYVRVKGDKCDTLVKNHDFD